MNQQQMDSQFVADEIAAICNSLGKTDSNDGTYMKDRDCKACLKELQRFINSDSKRHTARCTLGALNVIDADLIPLLVQYCDYNEGDSELFTIILRLCVNLTSPVLLLFDNQEIPTDTEGQQLHTQLLRGLFGFKKAFAANDKFWSFLNTHLKHNSEEEVTFERLIILIRNILHIPVDSTGEMGLHCEFDSHLMCIHGMAQSGLLSTLLEIAAESQRGTEYCFHIMEIIYLVLRDQNPETIAQARPIVLKRKLDDNDVDKRRFDELVARERMLRRTAPPISRFNGATFLVTNCRTLSGAPIVLNRPVSTREMIKFDRGKVDLRKAKNRKPLSSETSMMISDTNTRSSKITYSLKVFCKSFVERVYANYMQQIKHNLIQKKTQADDETYYLWSLQFFSAFNRHLSLPLDNISETISTSTLHYLQILMTSYQEKIKMEKKSFHDVSKRLHLALRAYKEVLQIMKSVDSPFAQTIETIKKNIFTDAEYSGLLLSMLQQYEEPKHSKHYTVDLVEANCLFLELLEEYSRTHTVVEIEENVAPEKVTKKKKRKADFRTAHFMSKYLCPDVIKVHLDVLKNFKSNRESTNKAILKFLQRIVYDCKNDVILFQASLFRILLQIMDIPGQEEFSELSKHLMERFGSLAAKKRWMFQELLFPKTCNDVVEIEHAIEPPVVPIDEQPPETAADEVLESQPVLPAETIADLLAELGSSDDDDDNGNNNNNNGNDDGDVDIIPPFEARISDGVPVISPSPSPPPLIDVPVATASTDNTVDQVMSEEA